MKIDSLWLQKRNAREKEKRRMERYFTRNIPHDIKFRCALQKNVYKYILFFKLIYIRHLPTLLEATHTKNVGKYTKKLANLITITIFSVYFSEYSGFVYKGFLIMIYCAVRFTAENR